MDIRGYRVDIYEWCEWVDNRRLPDMSTDNVDYIDINTRVVPLAMVLMCCSKPEVKVTSGKGSKRAHTRNGKFTGRYRGALSKKLEDGLRDIGYMVVAPSIAKNIMRLYPECSGIFEPTDSYPHIHSTL